MSRGIHLTKVFGLSTVLVGGLLSASAASANSVGGLESLTNQARMSNGLGALGDDYRLDRAATNKAADMITNDYWAHTSPSGITPWYWVSSAGYQYTYAGENLAQGFYSDAGVVAAWMNSAEHRSNILNPNYRDIGCGMASGVLLGKSTLVSVCMYGATSVAADSIGSAPAAIKASTPSLRASVELPRPSAATDPLSGNQMKTLAKATLDPNQPKPSLLFQKASGSLTQIEILEERIKAGFVTVEANKSLRKTTVTRLAAIVRWMFIPWNGRPAQKANQ